MNMMNVTDSIERVIWMMGVEGKTTIHVVERKNIWTARV